MDWLLQAFNIIYIIYINYYLLGIVSMYGGVNNDTNSTFIGNRNAMDGGATYLTTFSSAYYYYTKFIWNNAYMLAGAVLLNSKCYTLMVNVLVLGCTSYKGGVSILTERSSVDIINSTFKNNSAVSGGIFHSLENYGSFITINTSTFDSNQGNDNLFNMMNSNIIMFSCLFYNNLNTIFSLTYSNMTIFNVKISNHRCNNFMVGCVVNSIDKSSIFSSNLIMIGINNLKEEGNIYLEASNAVFLNSSFENLTNLKSLGSCFDLQSSSLCIDIGSFSNYDYNCLHAINSNITINNSLFNNIYSNNDENYNVLIKYGTIICISCLNISAYKSYFLHNIGNNYGGAFYVISNIGDFNIIIYLYNLSFVGNIVSESGGALYLDGINGKIINCLFQDNNANYGAGIYFEATCNIYIII